MPFVVGLNQETAPVELREKLSVAASHLTEMLEHLTASAMLEEAVILSTCNRTEIYARSDHRPAARTALIQEFQKVSRIETLSPRFYYYEDEDAVKHLFRVASGLDSMVKGENEILRQVKQAYLTAYESGFTGKLLNVLFQRSLCVGKRVRTETGLSSGSSSVGSVAVAIAQRIFGELQDHRILILGAGEMAETTVNYLLSQKVQSLWIANRTFSRAQALAAKLGGSALSFEEGLRELEAADIVICSTSAEQPVVQPDHIEAVMHRRKGRSLFFIDIAVPRNIDPTVHYIDNVYVYNIDDLQKIVADNQVKHSREISEAEKMVDQQTHEFIHWLRAHHAGIHHGLRHSLSS